MPEVDVAQPIGYEYKAVNLNFTGDLSEQLNVYAREGWRVIATINTLVILERIANTE